MIARSAVFFASVSASAGVFPPTSTSSIAFVTASRTCTNGPSTAPAVAGFCGDCNDSDQTINPHGKEVCDRVDNNCDGLVDALPGNANLCAACFDNDMDGQTNCDGDCDDADPAVFRGAPEVCDGKLNACGAAVGGPAARSAG